MTSRAQDHRTLQQGCSDKGKSQIVVTRRSSKRIYNGSANKQEAPNVVSHHQFMNMPLGGNTSMSSQPYDILGEEALMEDELMNGSYEMSGRIMARFWEESRSDDELTNESYEMASQSNNIVSEESRFEDEIMDGISNKEHEHGNVPIGGKSSMLCHFLGTVARNGKFCPIDVANWREMPRENKNNMLEVF
ncbi:hypothetical protein ACS0TY_029266 [Phlomoides rotata]